MCQNLQPTANSDDAPIDFTRGLTRCKIIAETDKSEKLINMIKVLCIDVYLVLELTNKYLATGHVLGSKKMLIGTFIRLWL